MPLQTLGLEPQPPAPGTLWVPQAEAHRDVSCVQVVWLLFSDLFLLGLLSA